MDVSEPPPIAIALSTSAFAPDPIAIVLTFDAVAKVPKATAKSFADAFIPTAIEASSAVVGVYNGLLISTPVKSWKAFLIVLVFVTPSLSVYSIVLATALTTSSPPIAIDESPLARTSPPIAIDCVPCAQAPLLGFRPPPIAID